MNLNLPDEYEWIFKDEGGCNDTEFEQVYELLRSDRKSGFLHLLFIIKTRKMILYFQSTDSTLQKMD